MNYFEIKKKEAKDFLDGEGEDKSTKGSVDKQILPLLKVINDIPYFYTTSSCAGRINLISSNSKKRESKWLFMSHDEISLHKTKEITDYLNLDYESIWFKMESPILHVCASSVNRADEFISLAKFCGLKRSGIMSASKRIMIESFSTENVEVPLRYNNKVLIKSDLSNYVESLIKISNERLKRSRKKLDAFSTKLKEKYDINDEL
ncbi:MAG: tRNA wybutosine-synthesizing 3 family protein [Candidatus Woesearchaeota archaeon]